MGFGGSSIILNIKFSFTLLLTQMTIYLFLHFNGCFPKFWDFASCVFKVIISLANCEYMNPTQSKLCGPDEILRAFSHRGASILHILIECQYMWTSPNIYLEILGLLCSSEWFLGFISLQRSKDPMFVS